MVGGAVSYLFLEPGADPKAGLQRMAAQPARAQQCAYAISRVSGFQRIGPLLSSEPVCESPRFEGLRSSIATLVDGMKASGKVGSASVYVRDFQKSEWTWYNGDEAYDPGSMLKIPLLLTPLTIGTGVPTSSSRVASKGTASSTPARP